MSPYWAAKMHSQHSFPEDYQTLHDSMRIDNEIHAPSEGQTTRPIIDNEPAPATHASLLAALIESASDAIISKNLDSIITSWNKGAERIFGYSAQEAIGQPVLMLIPPHLADEESIIIAKVRAGERVEHYQTLRRRKDGTLIDISLTVSPVRAADGTIVGASKIAHEVTSIEKAQEQLRASESRYQTLFNSIDEGFCVLQVIFDEYGTPVDWRFLEVNPAFERHNGLVDATGKLASELMPGLEQRWFEVYGHVARTGDPIRFEEGSAVLNRWFDLYAFRVGEPDEYKVAVLFNDITSRRQSEEDRERLLREVEAERSKLAYLFETSPSFVAMLRTPQHVFELVNPAYYQLIGYREVIGKSVADALPEVAAQGFIDLLDGVYRTGEPFSGREMPVQLQVELGGPLEQRFVEFVFQPIFGGSGEVEGIFTHGFDITEQVLSRRDAEIANRAKDEFLATLSHELRTPLNAILGWASLIKDRLLPEADYPDAIEAIYRNAQAQARLIEDIVDVSRIVTGKLRLDVQPTELAPIIEAAVESVSPAAEARSIRLQRVLDSGSSMVSGDPNRLQQVVWNLLTNAIKFTPKGGRVQVRLERVNSHIEIIVTDTGEGIAPEVLPHIFDRFRQADSTTTRDHGGLGLGLAIVRHVVEMHGGTVEVESEGQDKGATFTVKLPLIATRARESGGTATEPANEERVHPTTSRMVEFEHPPELLGLHVLIVDDDEDARSLVSTVLQQCKAKVTTANSASEALQKLQMLRPDVLLSDLGMPGEDGYSLITKVRALPKEKGGRTPAAALTAYARVEDRMKVLRSGFQIHLPKPVEPAELVAVVASLAIRGEKD
jgi:PAS domain S-box-containing protein